jgi:hypothetical protein
MIHNSHIILVTKQSCINGLLNDSMAVGIMLAITGLLVAKWVSILKAKVAGVMLNGINKIHLSQQRLDMSNIISYILRRSARLKVI